MPQHTVVGYIKFSENCTLPVKATKGSAALDLFSADYVVVSKGGGKAIVSTDIGLELPDNTCGIIMARSGLCLNKDITVFPGLIDADYRGPIKVILFNYGDEDFIIHQGCRIAQLLIQHIVDPILLEVRELNNTQRGKGGFGSSGY